MCFFFAAVLRLSRSVLVEILGTPLFCCFFPSKTSLFLFGFGFGLGSLTGACSLVLSFGFTERRAAGRYVCDECVLPGEGSTIRLLSDVYCPVNSVHPSHNETASHLAPAPDKIHPLQLSSHVLS